MKEALYFSDQIEPATLQLCPSITSPPMPEPQHFSDYGFDPQMDYFQVFQEARRQKREGAKSIDSIHFKLQKPISRDNHYSNKAHNKNKKRWWKTALVYFKQGCTHNHRRRHVTGGGKEDVHYSRVNVFRGSISGPVYVTESRSGSSTPCRSTSRPSTGLLAGIMEVEIPYMSHRELSMEERFQQQQRVSTSSAMPIYLVT